MSHSIQNVCVYCASSSKINNHYFEEAYALGKLLATHHKTVICGGGHQGLMRTVADGALDNGGKVIGVIPQFMIDEGWCYERIEHIEITQTMHERKKRMATLSDAIIALPGGCGTMEELLEIITWKQLGIYLNPIVILNTQGYYNSLISMLEHAIDENFMRNEHRLIWQTVYHSQDAIDALKNAPAWSADIRKFAAI